MFSVYGSGHVGIFGSTIKKRPIFRGFWKLIVLKPIFAKRFIPSDAVIINPYPEKKEIIVDGSNEAMDIYDSTIKN